MIIRKVYGVFSTFLDLVEQLPFFAMRAVEYTTAPPNLIHVSTSDLYSPKRCLIVGRIQVLENPCEELQELNLSGTAGTRVRVR